MPDWTVVLSGSDGKAVVSEPATNGKAVLSLLESSEVYLRWEVKQGDTDIEPAKYTAEILRDGEKIEAEEVGWRVGTGRHNYVVVVTAEDGGEVRSNELQVVEPGAEPAAAPDQKLGADTSDQKPGADWGLWDPVFAAVSGLALIIGSVLICVLAVRLGAGLAHDLSGLVPSDKVMDEFYGSYATRFASLVAVFLLGTGAIVMLIGLWLTALEVRGRLLSAAQLAQLAEQPATGPARGLAEALPKVIEALGRLRGSALVVIMGAALLFGAAWIGKELAVPRSADSAETGDATGSATSSTGAPGPATTTTPGGG